MDCPPLLRLLLRWVCSSNEKVGSLIPGRLSTSQRMEGITLVAPIEPRLIASQPAGNSILATLVAGKQKSGRG